MGVRRFDEHPVWQRARRFRQAIYRISADWPAEERYGLRGQIRRAAVSITSNFAEGFGRYHFQENIQHCRISRGSINECLDHLYAALDEHDTLKKCSTKCTPKAVNWNAISTAT